MDEARRKNKFKPINLHELFTDKYLLLEKWILTFVSLSLSRIPRIDSFKDPIHFKHGHQKDVEFTRSSKEAFNATLDVLGKENLQKDRPCSNFFYNLANTRKFPGIKTRLEIFFLPNETYKHRNQQFVITFGKPIFYEIIEKRHPPQEWARFVKDHVYIIAEDPQRGISYLKN